MNIEKWKSVAVDKESYYVLQALCKHGYRKPGAMISKLVHEMVTTLAKKKNKAPDKVWSDLLAQGFKLKQK